MNKGLRCVVCTGCGRCPGVPRQMHIVTERLEKRPVNLQNEKGTRLVTADVGTTTIAMQLHREDGSVEDSFVAVNPQSKYGSDVLSRIAAAGKWTGAGKTAATEQEALTGKILTGQISPAEDMRLLVTAVLQKGMAQFQTKLKEGETLLMVLAANTTMVYLLMGWNPAELGRAPFRASHLEGIKTEIAGVPCYIMPGLSAFVGGDILSGIHACGIAEGEETTLLIDLGTNGEMVLGDAHRLYACATAAGPAFEGGVNAGRWGSDMVSLIAEMRMRRLIDEEGLLQEPYFETGVRIGDICVTQEAVRAIQLAKAAIAAGITILCREYGCTFQEIGRVILAGGFGYYLKPEDAAEIGLLPQPLVSRTVTGGNTALTGALYIGERLLGGEEFAAAAAIGDKAAPQIHIINLAETAGFEKIYLESVSF